MGIAAIAILPTFRCLEAMYGYSPQSSNNNVSIVETSMHNYKLYFSFPGEIIFNTETKLPSSSKRNDIKRLFILFMIQYLCLGMLYSILIPMNYAPFGNSISFCYMPFSFFGSCCTILDKLMNNFILACKYILYYFIVIEYSFLFFYLYNIH